MVLSAYLCIENEFKQLFCNNSIILLKSVFLQLYTYEKEVTDISKTLRD